MSGNRLLRSNTSIARSIDNCHTFKSRKLRASGIVVPLSGEFSSTPPLHHSITQPLPLRCRRFLLKHEQRRTDLDPVPISESAAIDGLAVDEGGLAEREVFQLEAAGDDVDGGMAAADLGGAEEVDLAVRAAADEGRAAVEDELLAGDQPLGDAEPAGLGDVLDDA